MVIVGKLLGGYIGLQTARFLGLNLGACVIVGAIFGHVGDVWLHMKIQQSRARKYWSARLRSEFAERLVMSVFSMVGKLCEADGPLNQPENDAIATLMNDSLRLNRRDKKRALMIVRNHRRTGTSFQMDAVQFFELYHQEPVVLFGLLSSLFQIAVADGPIHPEEERLIAAAAQIFGMDEHNYLELRGRFVSGGHASYGYHGSDSSNGSGSRAEERQGPRPATLAQSYTVLGCTPEDTPQKIKQSYRKLVSDYHPDKIVSKDLPEGFVQFANEKFKSIQEAYEAVKSARGFS